MSNTPALTELNPLIRLGTSSWNYPGWHGLVYHRPYENEKQFRNDSLAEYAEFPWFRTVGIDSSFYSPPSQKLLFEYSSKVPDTFRWVSKVWEEITIPRYPRHKRYGAKAGKENPNFLNASLFTKQVADRFDHPDVKARTGPFVFQFQSLTKAAVQSLQHFIERLDSFLAALPKEWQYAVEVRNAELLTSSYFETLNKHGVAHCFNHWTYMPPLNIQMRRAADAGGLTAPFHIARLLTPLGVSYEEAVRQFSPYDSIKEEIPQMRLDALRLARRGIAKNIPTFILVNNRLEGCAPLTVQALTSLIISNPE